MTEQLTESELAYHEKIVNQYKEAQAAKQQIIQIEGAFGSWSQHLNERYELGNDGYVDEEGNVVKPD